jgi:hypothetical protein
MSVINFEIVTSVFYFLTLQSSSEISVKKINITVNVMTKMFTMRLKTISCT